MHTFSTQEQNSFREGYSSLLELRRTREATYASQGQSYRKQRLRKNNKPRVGWIPHENPVQSSLRCVD